MTFSTDTSDQRISKFQGCSNHDLPIKMGKHFVCNGGPLNLCITDHAAVSQQ